MQYNLESWSGYAPCDLIEQSIERKEWYNELLMRTAKIPLGNCTEWSFQYGGKRINCDLALVCAARATTKSELLSKARDSTKILYSNNSTWCEAKIVSTSPEKSLHGAPVLIPTFNDTSASKRKYNSQLTNSYFIDTETLCFYQIQSEFWSKDEPLFSGQNEGCTVQYCKISNKPWNQKTFRDYWSS